MDLNNLMNNLNLDDIKKQFNGFEGMELFGLLALFNDEFMAKYTNFSSITELLQKGNFPITSLEDLKNVTETDLNKFISENTKFSSWKEMYETAVGQ